MEEGCNFASICLTSQSSQSSLGPSEEQAMAPKSPPPGLLDLYGKRKQMVKIQVLEREIALLQEELVSLEGLHPASRCCNELDSFVGSISDPFTPINQKISKSHQCQKQTSHLWTRCHSHCLLSNKLPTCNGCCGSSNSNCHGRNCLKITSAQNCCRVPKNSNASCACCCVCMSCKGTNLGSNCVENCCHSCCL